MSKTALARTIVCRYRQGERSFVGSDFGNEFLDLRDATLAGADFSGLFLDADFRGANLAGCKFVRGNVKGCDFRGARLDLASFEGAAIDGAEFDSDGIAAANFNGASEQGHIYHCDEKPHRA